MQAGDGVGQLLEQVAGHGQHLQAAQRVQVARQVRYLVLPAQRWREKDVRLAVSLKSQHASPDPDAPQLRQEQAAGGELRQVVAVHRLHASTSRALKSDMNILHGDTAHTNVSRFSSEDIRAGTALIVLPDKRRVFKAFS